jgi:hypothetical protein
MIINFNNILTIGPQDAHARPLSTSEFSASMVITTRLGREGSLEKRRGLGYHVVVLPNLILDAEHVITKIFRRSRRNVFRVFSKL